MDTAIFAIEPSYQGTVFLPAERHRVRSFTDTSFKYPLYNQEAAIIEISPTAKKLAQENEERTIDIPFFTKQKNRNKN